MEFKFKISLTIAMANHIGRFSENIKALVVKDNDNYWATSDFSLTSTIVKQLYRNRQAIEEFSEFLNPN